MINNRHDRDTNAKRDFAGLQCVLPYIYRSNVHKYWCCLFQLDSIRFNINYFDCFFQVGRFYFVVQRITKHFILSFSNSRSFGSSLSLNLSFVRFVSLITQSIFWMKSMLNSEHLSKMWAVVVFIDLDCVWQLCVVFFYRSLSHSSCTRETERQREKESNKSNSVQFVHFDYITRMIFVYFMTALSRGK